MSGFARAESPIHASDGFFPHGAGLQPLFSPVLNLGLQPRLFCCQAFPGGRSKAKTPALYNLPSLIAPAVRCRHSPFHSGRRMTA